MSKLENLLLSGNELTGSIPWSIGSLSALQRLDLSTNRLSGQIPRELGDLTSLKALGLHHNRLSGPIPWELSGVRTLKRLIVNDNDLTGAVPPEISEMSGLAHINVANNPLDTLPAIGKSDIGEIENKRSEVIGGLDALNETTMVIGNPQTWEFITEVMSAISVQEGLLQVDLAALPEAVDADELEGLVDRMNRRLRDAGETIESTSDLERVLELYGEGRIDVPEEPANGAVFRAEVSGPAPLVKEGTRVVTKKQSIRLPAAGIDCPGMKAHFAHKSSTTAGTIIGKASGRCNYVYGPLQSLTYDAEVNLEKKWGWWIYSAWYGVGQSGHKRKTGNMPSWHENELVAVTPCDSGTFRTRLLLYISGSSSGNFKPYPGVYRSASRKVSC